MNFTRFKMTQDSLFNDDQIPQELIKKSLNPHGGGWTEQKLKKLNSYMTAYLKVLSKQEWCRKNYIEGFAGAGEYDTGDGNIKDGSAKIALKQDFDKYYFIEKDVKKLENLKFIANEFEKIKKCEFIIGDVNVELPKVMQQLSTKDRNICFLDPFGMQVDWQTIQSIKKSKSQSDVLYLFPINIFIRELAKSIQNKTTPYHISKFIGKDKENWVNDFQKIKENPMDEILFNEHEKITIQKNIDEITPQLIQYFEELFEYVAKNPLVLKNTKNAPMFHLFFMMTNTRENATSIAKRLIGDTN